MSRDDGFAVMDISTSIHEDQKFKRLARRHPELVAPAFLAYVATVAESWRAGDRVPIGDAWPALLSFDRAVVTALKRFELLERDGRVACETWNLWFLPALERKLRAKERWARANAKRHAALMADDAQDSADATTLPRGSDAVTGATVPSVPSVPSDSPKPPPSGGHGLRANGTNKRAIAAELTRRSEEAERERKTRRTARQRAYLDGRLTEGQRDEMNDRDAPLEEIPSERGAAYREGVTA